MRAQAPSHSCRDYARCDATTAPSKASQYEMRERHCCPIGELLGMRAVLVKRDEAVVELDVTPAHANPLGTLHGGVFCDVADYAMGLAWRSGVDHGETFATVELKINFFRPFRTGRVTAEAKVIRRGRTIGYVECDVKDIAGKILARASSTCMTLRGERAIGR